jgi:hypothetical protein
MGGWSLMSIADPVVMPLARELLDCFNQELDKVANPPLYRGFRPGNVVDHLLSTWQDECCSGLAWVRIVSFGASSAVFPTQDTVPQPKGPLSWAITLEMGVVRCSPTPDADSIPTADQWEEVVQAIMDDGAAMRRAICCFTAAVPNRGRSVLPQPWQPISVEGGCAGGVMTVVVRGPACDCSDAGPISS